MCKNESTLKNLREAIPWRLFLGAFLLIVVLAYVFPIAPSGDGPYQTLNWISRIKHGQIPGRDFDVFHGIGVLWFHALLAWPFGADAHIEIFDFTESYYNHHRKHSSLSYLTSVQFVAENTSPK